MTDEPIAMPMHIMITVSDYDRAVAFYTKALGFSIGYEREAAVAYDPALQLHDVAFREGFLVLGQMMIALVCFERPACIPAPPHAQNQVGIKHISFGVPDIDVAARRVEALGGKVLEHTRSISPQAELLVVTDPDGTHLGLVRRKG